MSQLDILVQHRETILLCEIAAWLHDDFKHTDQQIFNYVRNAPTSSGRQDTSDLVSKRNLSLYGKTIQFATVKNRKKDDFVDGYLNRCHYTAHIEKEDGNSKQDYPAYLSSPFGFEATKIPSSLTNSLRTQITWNLIDKSPFTSYEWKCLQEELEAFFSKVGGDTRRPTNEITLWEWGHTVGSLYKAALVGSFFKEVETPAKKLHWRLLSVRLDGLHYALQVSRLPDLLSRQTLITDSLNRVKELLEVTYPIGSEVYRDESGTIFVVPDLSGFLDNLTNQHGLSLRQIILNEFSQGTLENRSHLQIGEEIVPEVNLDDQAWWGQDPDRNTKKQSGLPLNNEIPPVGRLIAKNIFAYPDPKAVETFWEKWHGGICTVCGLRPQGPSQKSQERNVCNTCEQRRADRSMEWAKGQTQDTIWIDEVSDINGRVALICGQYDLEHWIDGSFVESLFVIPAGDTSPEVKSASFTRIRRIWETTRRFWQETQEHLHSILSDDRRRLQIWLDKIPNIGDFHAYELELGKTNLSVVWYPPANDGSGGYFISAGNLSYTARQLGAEKTLYADQAAAAIFVEDYIQKQFVYEKQNPILHNTETTKIKKRNLIAKHFISHLQHQDSAYSTAIPILAEPRTFMALVPADKALEIAQAIQTKYEQEMGKVRNRLPLHLGIVYAHRRTPFRAILDAGRRMLEQKPLGADNLWTVKADSTTEALPDIKKELSQNTKQFQQTISVQLEQNCHSLTWYVPALMGDGTTPDCWYPYVFFQADKDGSKEPGGRKRAFKGLRPTSNDSEACWLVHAGELREGDKVYFTPATFDFEWLDTAARRFEIAYSEQGKRIGRLTRPYLLDALNAIRRAWELIAGKDRLTTSQIHALREVIETRREAWYDQPQQSISDPTFRQFCHNALRNAQWKTFPSDDDMRLLTDWTVSGLLSDAIKLYMGVMKAKPEQDK